MPVSATMRIKSVLGSEDFEFGLIFVAFRALDLPDLGPIFGPFPMQNSIFFPNLDPKFSQFDSLKKNGKVEKKMIRYANTSKISRTEYLISKSTLVVCKMDNKICLVFSQF